MRKPLLMSDTIVNTTERHNVLKMFTGDSKLINSVTLMLTNITTESIAIPSESFTDDSVFDYAFCLHSDTCKLCPPINYTSCFV